MGHVLAYITSPGTWTSWKARPQQGVVKRDWVPTGRIDFACLDFNATDADQPSEFRLLVEERRTKASSESRISRSSVDSPRRRKRKRSSRNTTRTCRKTRSSNLCSTKRRSRYHCQRSYRKIRVLPGLRFDLKGPVRDHLPDDIGARFGPRAGRRKLFFERLNLHPKVKYLCPQRVALGPDPVEHVTLPAQLAFEARPSVIELLDFQLKPPHGHGEFRTQQILLHLDFANRQRQAASTRRMVSRTARSRISGKTASPRRQPSKKPIVMYMPASIMGAKHLPLDLVPLHRSHNPVGPACRACSPVRRYSMHAPVTPP